MRIGNRKSQKTRTIELEKTGIKAIKSSLVGPESLNDTLLLNYQGEPVSRVTSSVLPSAQCSLAALMTRGARRICGAAIAWRTGVVRAHVSSPWHQPDDLGEAPERARSASSVSSNSAYWIRCRTPR